jgi:hypothetical protein
MFDRLKDRLKADHSGKNPNFRHILLARLGEDRWIHPLQVTAKEGTKLDQ